MILAVKWTFLSILAIKENCFRIPSYPLTPKELCLNGI